MRQKVLWLKPTIFFLLLFLQGEVLFSRQTNILLLHSYHEGFKWTDDINTAIKKKLLEEDGDIQFFVEYMDSKRISIEGLFPQLADLYRVKYSEQPLDLIIISDNSAFHFLKIYRDELFGQIPVIFTGLNGFADSQLEEFPLVTGVIENEDLPGTIDLILSLQSDITHIGAVSDNVPTGKLHEQIFAQLIPLYKDRVTLVPLAGLSQDNLAKALNELPEHSAVIYLSYFNDGEGSIFNGEEGVKKVCNLTDLPVYSLWDWAIGAGPVGGVVVSGERQGSEAAEMAIHFLRGTSIEDIPVLKKSPNVPYFDFIQLERVLDLTERIPYRSVLINKPESFYEENKVLFWFMIGFFALLVAMVLSLISDVLRRKKMTVVLREQRNILQSTLDHIPLYVFWKDKSGQILGCNKLFFSRFLKSGQRVDSEVYTEPDFSLEERDTLSDLEFMSEKNPVLFHEASLRDSQGAVRDYVMTVISFFDKDSPLNRIIIIQDISQRRQLEKQLKQSQKMEALGRISGGIAHDFNNLLTGILGASDMLRADNLNYQEKTEFLDMIQESCDQGSGLIKRLLSFSRKTPVEFADISVSELMMSMEQILKRTIEKTIKITISIKEQGLTLPGDRSMLQSTLLNLGINASHAMKGYGKLTYCVESIPFESVPQDDDYTPRKLEYLKIKVSDTGEGMAPDTLDKLFDPFFTTKEQGKGTGLGLTGVYGCVQTHGGKITVQSQINEGSVFTLYLPMLANQPEDQLFF